MTSSPSITRFSSSFRPSSQRLSTRRLPSGYREWRGSSTIACAGPRVPPRSAIAEGPRGAVHGGARLAEVVVYDLVWRLIPRTRIYAVCTSSSEQRTTTPFSPSVARRAAVLPEFATLPASSTLVTSRASLSSRRSVPEPRWFFSAPRRNAFASLLHPGLLLVFGSRVVGSLGA